MDVKALFNLSYGLYVIGARDGDRNVGCVVNTVTQATATPVTLTVCINKDNYTNACIKKTKEFAVSILSEAAKENTIAVFGFSSSKDRDKFANTAYALTPSGMPYIKEGVTGYLQCKVINFVDHFTHTIFIAEVTEAENISNAQGSLEAPMTYAYYHKVIKGKTPKNASSYVAEEKETVKKETTKTEGSYKCDICGYIYTGSKEEFEKLPSDYQCPICRVPKDMFKPL